MLVRAHRGVALTFSNVHQVHERKMKPTCCDRVVAIRISRVLRRGDVPTNPRARMLRAMRYSLAFVPGTAVGSMCLCN